MSIVHRSEVVSMWLDVLAGRVSREEACQWAGPLMLGDAPFEDVMTGQGLQYLHGLDLAHDGTDPNLVHHGRPGVYLRTDQDVRNLFERWQQRCADFDADPAGWLAQARRGAPR